MKFEFKEIKELRLKNPNTTQQVGQKNYQVEKSREGKKELVSKHRNLQRRCETLEKNSNTTSEFSTVLVAQHEYYKKKS